MKIIDISEEKHFSKQEFRPIMLHSSSEIKVPLICMEDRQSIPPHPGGNGVFYVIEGSAIFTLGEDKKEVQAGSVVIVPPGTSRGIEARGKVVILAVSAE